MHSCGKARSPAFKGTGSRDKDGTDAPCARQIADVCLLKVSVCLPDRPEVTPAVGTLVQRQLGTVGTGG